MSQYGRGENIGGRRTARRLTHGLITRTWQRSLLTGLRESYAHQLLTMTTRPAKDE